MSLTKRYNKHDPLWKENDFKANKKGQRNTIFAVNGDNYTGEWDNNKKHGKGTQFWKKSGAVYDGDWIGGTRNGFGTFCLPNSTGGSLIKIYAGCWLDDKKHGHGTYYYDSDSFYEGEWKLDLRCGWGRMYYEDGSVYEGEWLDDKRNGAGLLRFKNDNRFEGVWKNDQKHGDGKYFYLDKGQLLLGNWFNDVSKCGEIHDFLHDSAVDATQFLIPELKLLDSNEVLDRAREWFKTLQD